VRDDRDEVHRDVDRGQYAHGGPPRHSSRTPQVALCVSQAAQEPLTDARHVRNAVVRFDRVMGVSEPERRLAFANIQKAAAYCCAQSSASTEEKEEETRVTGANVCAFWSNGGRAFAGR
jgi:hypothetical protein